jgi:hypothetical protein
VAVLSYIDSFLGFDRASSSDGSRPLNSIIGSERESFDSSFSIVRGV